MIFTWSSTWRPVRWWHFKTTLTVLTRFYEPKTLRVGFKKQPREEENNSARAYLVDKLARKKKKPERNRSSASRHLSYLSEFFFPSPPFLSPLLSFQRPSQFLFFLLSLLSSFALSSRAKRRLSAAAPVSIWNLPSAHVRKHYWYFFFFFFFSSLLLSSSFGV